MSVNTYEMWSKGIKIAIFSENLQKLPSGWGLCPQTPVCDTLECTRLLNTSRKLDICTFYVFSPSPFTKVLVKCQQVTASDLPFYKTLPHKNFLFWKILMTSMQVSCGLPPLQSKILATPMRTSLFKLPHQWNKTNIDITKTDRKKIKRNAMKIHTMWRKVQFNQGN